MEGKHMKKILKFLLVVLLLFPLNGCYRIAYLNLGSSTRNQVKVSHKVSFWGNEETGEISEGKVDFYIGHRYNALERLGLFDYISKRYIYDNITIGLRIDDNEEYSQKVEIPAEEFFESDYYVQTFFEKDKMSNALNKNFSFSLKGLAIESKFSMEFNYTDYSKEKIYTYIHKYVFLVDIVDDIIFVNDDYFAWVRISLESGDIYVEKSN